MFQNARPNGSDTVTVLTTLFPSDGKSFPSNLYLNMQKIFNRILIIYSCCAFGSIILIVKFSDYFSSDDYEEPPIPIILNIKYGKNIQMSTINIHDEELNNNDKKVTLESVNININSNQVTQVTSDDDQVLRTTKSIRYDDKVTDEFRLGYRINSPVLTLPRSWQEILKEQVADMQENGNSDKIENSTNYIKPKKIYLYDSFDWWKFGGVLKCPSLSPGYKCEFKDSENVDKDFRFEGEQDFSDLDAVIMVRDFQHADPPFSLTNQSLTRIFFTLESPFATNFVMSMSPRDYLASYWRGSDIYAPYFKWNYYDPKITRKPQNVDYTIGKTKMVAAVISNCNAPNRRLDLIEELQKYIKVDVYGVCGEIDCQARTDRSSCFEDIKNDYKFYLSFENSNCRDYITEKLHQNAYENDLLPIVYGAHPNDYSSLVPAHSYLHIEDFESIKDLADYLTLLNSNDTLYNEYFEWKNTGEFVPGHFLCEACAFTHLLQLDNDISNSRTFVHDKSFELESLEELTYLNTRDSYDFKNFNWNPENELMCLNIGQYYWNK